MVLPKKNNSVHTLPVARIFSLLSVAMLVCLIYACSSASSTALKGKRPSSGEFNPEPLVGKRNNALIALKAEGSLTVDVDGRVQKGQFVGTLYKRDSLMLTVLGPFNIVAFKIASTPDYMNFYDVLGGTLYQGTPNQKNFQARLGVPLSHSDIASFLRGDIPDGFTGFKAQAVENDSEQVYLRQRDTVTERVIYSFAEEAFINYKRIGAKGNTIINARYSNFTTSDNIRLPLDALIVFPPINATFSVQCRTVEANPKDQKYTFTPPMEARRKRL